MNAERIEQVLEAYNWDDGFELPQRLLGGTGCDLGIALNIFYLADGDAYLMDRSIQGPEPWLSFVSQLYERIVRGEFVRSKRPFEIPLTKVQRYKLAKLGVEPVFLTDLQGDQVSPGRS